MSKTKIAITLDEDYVTEIDHLVQEHRFLNRSQAIQEAVREKLQKLTKNRLAQECAKLDPAYEQALADEGLSEDLREWPEY